MSNEHNPIAILISKLQQKWIEEVSPVPEYKWVRWLIKPGQGRLYEGFLKLEASPHGSLPEVVVTLLSPFSEGESFSKRLITDWLEIYKKEFSAEEGKGGTPLEWDYSGYEQALLKTGQDFDGLLRNLLHSFQQALPEKQKLVLALLPQTVSDPDHYVLWIEKLLKVGMPDNVVVMLLDYTEERYFDSVFTKYPALCKSLYVELDLDGAISKLAKAGDPNSPEVQFKECILEMSNALKANSTSDLHLWGKKALEIAKRTANKSFFASAYLIYAGMLFQKNLFGEVDTLLEKGLALAEKGWLEEEDITCQPVILQLVGYQAASLQHQGKVMEAAKRFSQQGEKAKEFKMGIQALMAWYQAYNLYQQHDASKYAELLAKAYQQGAQLLPEELKTSCMPYVGYDYHQYLQNLRQFDKCKEIETFMVGLEGKDWKEVVEQYKKDTQKKKKFLLF